MFTVMHILLALQCTTVSDFLVFLAGEEDIETLHELLLEKLTKLPSSAARYMVTPIYAGVCFDG